MSRNRVLATAALLVGLLLPGQLLAAWTAVTRADLNLRVGPNTTYGVIDVIPAGEPVDVIGCIEGLEWCDVEWLGLRGFVYAYYLVQPGTSVYLPQYAPSVGLPIIGFSFDTYHDRHYRDRSWYGKRRWSGRWRERRHRRFDGRGERRRERVEERRERRREVMRERRPRVEERRRRRIREEPRRPRVEERRRIRVEEPRRRRVQEQTRQRGRAVRGAERGRWEAPDTPPGENWGR